MRKIILSILPLFLFLLAVPFFLGSSKTKINSSDELKTKDNNSFISETQKRNIIC